MIIHNPHTFVLKQQSSTFNPYGWFTESKDCLCDIVEMFPPKVHFTKQGSDALLRLLFLNKFELKVF